MKRLINFSTTLLSLTCLIAFVPKISVVKAQETASQSEVLYISQIFPQLDSWEQQQQQIQRIQQQRHHQ